MPFPSSAVGSELEPSTTTVSTRRVLAYAAGIGETDPHYLDDAREDGIFAPPAFCVSLEWAVVAIDRRQTQLSIPLEEARRGVHAIQDSIFHQPIRPGDKLKTRATLVSAQPIKAGTLAVTKLETTNTKTNAPVVTSWSSAIYRDVELEGSAVSYDQAPPLPENAIAKLSDRAGAVDVYIPREMPHTYTECADIWNPIHTEREVALAAGLPDIILHGTATWALAAREVTRAYAGGDGRKLKRLHGRFVGMVVPGQDISIRHERDEQNPRLVRFDVQSGKGGRAIDQGFALFE